MLGPGGRPGVNEASWNTSRLRTEDIRLARSTKVGKVKRHQVEVIQMFLPNVPPAVDDPPIMFQDFCLLRRIHPRLSRHTSRLASSDS